MINGSKTSLLLRDQWRLTHAGSSKGGLYIQHTLRSLHRTSQITERAFNGFYRNNYVYNLNSKCAFWLKITSAKEENHSGSNQYIEIERYCLFDLKILSLRHFIIICWRKKRRQCRIWTCAFRIASWRLYQLSYTAISRPAFPLSNFSTAYIILTHPWLLDAGGGRHVIRYVPGWTHEWFFHGHACGVSKITENQSVSPYTMMSSQRATLGKSCRSFLSRTLGVAAILAAT